MTMPYEDLFYKGGVTNKGRDTERLTNYGAVPYKRDSDEQSDTPQDDYRRGFRSGYRVAMRTIAAQVERELFRSDRG